MLGVYDYTVILTYFSLAVSMFGMTQAIGGRMKTAVICLALSALCDMFDGKIARTKKNRTEEQKSFGIQIDSLCDVICFGVFPALLCHLLGVQGALGCVAIAFYCICGVIRLAWFNVLEGKRQQEGGTGACKHYHGLPIPSMAVVLPVLCAAGNYLPPLVFSVLLYVALFLVGLLFVVDFQLKKPKDLVNFLLAAVVAVALVVLFIGGNGK